MSLLNGAWFAIESLNGNNSIGIGERDRPGRPGRRPADWLDAPQASPYGVRVRRRNVFGGTPKTATGTVALPGPTESFRLNYNDASPDGLRSLNRPERSR